MSSVNEHIRSIDESICRNIETLVEDRGLLSQSLLSQLRNLVEGVAVLIHTNNGDTEHDYDAIVAGLAHVKAALRILGGVRRSGVA
ncbi:hypothetical protein [Microbacterium lacticum]